MFGNMIFRNNSTNSSAIFQGLVELYKGLINSAFVWQLLKGGCHSNKRKSENQYFSQKIFCHTAIPKRIEQVALLWQKDRATRLSVEILQLQNIPIIWHYLRDPTYSRFYTISEYDRHTHRNGRTDTRRRHVLR